jgi:hypothetical protein
MEEFIKKIKAHKYYRYLKILFMFALFGLIFLPYAFDPEMLVVPIVIGFCVSFLGATGLVAYIILDSFLHDIKMKNLWKKMLMSTVSLFVAVVLTYSIAFKVVKYTHNAIETSDEIINKLGTKRKK